TDALVVGPVDRGLVPHGRGRDTGLSRGVWPRRRTVFGRRRLSGRRLERAWSAGVPIWPRGCGRRLSAGRQAADGAVRRIQRVHERIGAAREPPLLPKRVREGFAFRSQAVGMVG